MTRSVKGDLPVSFRYTPGVANTAFFEALRDRAVLLGSRCHSCEVTYLPARIFCERCFGELSPETECGPGGVLESFTVGHTDVDGQPLNEPMALGLVRVDGADTVLVHRLLDMDAPAIGARVIVRLAPERTGSILDIEGFGPQEA
jgi:uncharacterized OB-fold protein